MSYVDAVYSKDDERIYVVERTSDGQRNYVDYPVNYTLYYGDPKGKHRDLYGRPVTRFTTRKRTEFEKERRLHARKGLCESDINPVFRCLSENYLGSEAPKLHTCFFDIEVAFDSERGFAPTEDPFNPITSISLYNDWMDTLITLVIAPQYMSSEIATQICNEYPNTFLFATEAEMFNTFFDLIEDADVLTGWNSEGYDIPYTVNRVTRVLSKDDTRRFCLLGQLPKQREYERFGKIEYTYDLVGRVHMDYLQLYKKYNYESRHSYSLDSIGEMEVGERKTQYEGTLDQLYNRDFSRFIQYNRQDVMLMYRIHSKLKFLDLANQLAHENTVLLPTVMGSVAMIEQAVVNEAHGRGLVVPDKRKKEADNDDISKSAAGAYVATPQVGIHEWVGAVDINSLYPSVIRALNLAPETIVGQIRQTLTDRHLSARAGYLNLGKRARQEYESDGGDEDVEGNLLWDGLFGSLEYTSVMNCERGTMLTVDWSDGRSEELSAAEIWEKVFNSHNPYILTANGTIFTYEREGVIPGLLSKWYSERKEIQKKLKAAQTVEEREYYDKRQLVRKILLNSAYGALLNEHCRFYDKRIGQSVTLSGRQIVKHMMSHINEQVCGQYQHDGPAIVYGDTDSCYFSAYSTFKAEIDAGQLEWSKEHAIAVYDAIADATNSSFPQFMERAFHAPPKNGAIIRAGRELIGDRALFIKKKKYAINIYDKEGTRLDVDGRRGKIKAMGLDTKRSDTPKYVQEFLQTVLDRVLRGDDRTAIIDYIVGFKREISERPAWELGSPRAANKLTHYSDLLDKLGAKVAMPGHVRAALNWNNLRRMWGDNYSMRIADGMKVVVCKLKPNAMGYTSIAYPVDEARLPEWFRELPFDTVAMEETLIDKKLDNLIGVLKWDFKQHLNIHSSLQDLFTFA